MNSEPCPPCHPQQGQPPRALLTPATGFPSRPQLVVGRLRGPESTGCVKRSGLGDMGQGGERSQVLLGILWCKGLHLPWCNYKRPSSLRSRSIGRSSSACTWHALCCPAYLASAFADSCSGFQRPPPPPHPTPHVSLKNLCSVLQCPGPNSALPCPPDKGSSWPNLSPVLWAHFSIRAQCSWAPAWPGLRSSGRARSPSQGREHPSTLGIWFPRPVFSKNSSTLDVSS